MEAKCLKFNPTRAPHGQEKSIQASHLEPPPTQETPQPHSQLAGHPPYHRRSAQTYLALSLIDIWSLRSRLVGEKAGKPQTIPNNNHDITSGATVNLLASTKRVLYQHVGSESAYLVPQEASAISLLRLSPLLLFQTSPTRHLSPLFSLRSSSHLCKQ